MNRRGFLRLLAVAALTAAATIYSPATLLAPRVREATGWVMITLFGPDGAVLSSGTTPLSFRVNDTKGSVEAAQR